MTNVLAPEADWARLSDLIAEKMGLHFPESRWQDLRRGLAAAAGDLGCADMASCAERLLSSSLTRGEIEVLAGHLTVGETSFFRDPAVFDTLEHLVLPPLLESRAEGERRLRVWSAGCASGEEAYSLAIVLDRLLRHPAHWDFTILATDMNPHSLARARRGVYRKWSFRGTMPGFKETYFRKEADGDYLLLPAYKAHVSVEYLNLVDDSYPSFVNNTNGMDLILCRNVLMYFSDDVRERVIERFHRCLVDGGWLVTSQSEAFAPLFRGFQAVTFPGMTFYRRTECAESPMPADSGPSDTPLELPDDVVFPSASSVAWVAEAGAGGAPAEPPSAPALPSAEPRPESGPSLHRAVRLYHGGSYAEAERQALELLSGDPVNVRAMELVARSRANLGHIAEALSWCDKAIARDPMNARLHYLRAVILQEMGRMHEARDALRRVLYLEPGSALGLFSMGNLELQQGRRQEARRAFDGVRNVLRTLDPDAILPDSDGVSARRLAEIVESILNEEVSR